MNERPDFAAELKHDMTDVRAVLEGLGLLEGSKRQAGGYVIRCPWHNERTASCSVQLRGGIIQAHCFACHHDGEGASVLDMVAAVHGLDTRSRFVEVLRAAAELANRPDIIDALDGKADRARPRPSPQPRPPMPPEPERTYPPLAEVAAVWEACTMTADDAEVAAWFQSRALDAAAVDVRGLARALPRGASVPRWARCAGQSWAESGHRLIVPFFDALGEMRTVRASRVVAGDSPKRLTPTGHKSSGVVMADALALEVLRTGARPDWLAAALRVVIAEGEPDWLTWATMRPLKSPTPAYAVLGVIAGSWADAFAARIPNGARVIVRTDHDAAGDKYATDIIRTLAPRCAVYRSKGTA